VSEIQPLSGVRVLAIEQLMALPFGTQLLADFGADVVGVETVGYGGDEAVPWRERTGRFKRRAQIRLDDPRGQELVRRLAGRFDVLAENYRPGVLARYGLGYADLQPVNDRLIYVSVSGYGHPEVLESPYWNMAAYGPIGEAMSGAMYAIRAQGGSTSGMALGDIVASVFATLGTLVALRHRDLTGKGQYVDISMADALMALAELPFTQYSLSLDEQDGDGERPKRPPLGYPRGAFTAADGEFELMVLNDGHFGALCGLLGHDEWRHDPLILDPQTRPAVVDERVIPVLAEWAKGLTKLEAAERCRAVGLAAAPINGPDDVMKDRHFAARRMVETVIRPDGRPLRVVGDPIKLSSVEAGRNLAAKALLARPGQHTRQLLREELELGDDEITSLVEAGVVAE
jgi:crotonobetainyl-CoA:carnitine CoA-transferase CaiB-like acyl-CoA transferase